MFWEKRVLPGAGATASVVDTYTDHMQMRRIGTSEKRKMKVNDNENENENEI